MYPVCFFVQNVRVVLAEAERAQSLFLTTAVARAPEGPGCTFLGVACSQLS